jgi:hypothetical protein
VGSEEETARLKAGHMSYQPMVGCLSGVRHAPHPHTGVWLRRSDAGSEVEAPCLTESAGRFGRFGQCGVLGREGVCFLALSLVIAAS